MQAKDIKPIKKQKKKGFNIFFVIIEGALILFVIACVSMGLPLLAVMSGAMAIFISPIPDYFLVKMGKKPITKNMRFVVGAIGFIAFCYLIPSDKIAAVTKQQEEQLREQLEKSLETAESETVMETEDTSDVTETTDTADTAETEKNTETAAASESAEAVSEKAQ